MLHSRGDNQPNFPYSPTCAATAHSTERMKAAQH